MDIVPIALAGKERQVRQRHATPRRAQHGKPGQRIGAMHQRESQGEQVEDERPGGKRIDVDRLKGDARAMQGRNDVAQVAA